MGVDATRLVRRYYVFSGIYTLAASIIWGINTLFLLDAGLTIGEVFIANSAFSAGTVLFEIPTGVVADTIGRRPSFLLSVAVLAGTTLGYVGLAEIDAGLVSFALVSVVMGLGFTFYSGAMEAWLVDGLRFHDYDGELDDVFARGQIISGVALLVGTVGGGLLGQIDLALPFLLRSTLLALLFVLAWGSMHDLGFQRRTLKPSEIPREAANVASAGVTFGWRQRSMRLLILASTIQMGFFAWAWYAWQPYFLELLESDAVWVAGVVAAILAVSMIVGNGIVQIVTRWCGRRTTLFLWSGALFSVAMVGVGAVDSFPLAVACLAFAGVSFGVQSPVRQAFVHETVPSEQRATVVSFDSMFVGGGGVVGQTGLGAFSEREGFSAGYILGGGLTILALPLLLRVRRYADDADFFEGTHAPVSGSCAPKGIPHVAQLEGELVTVE